MDSSVITDDGTARRCVAEDNDNDDDDDDDDIVMVFMVLVNDSYNDGLV